MTNYQKATEQSYTNKYIIKQIKICSKKEDRNNIKMKYEKL